VTKAAVCVGWFIYHHSVVFYHVEAIFGYADLKFYLKNVGIKNFIVKYVSNMQWRKTIEKVGGRTEINNIIFFYLSVTTSIC